VAVTKQTDVGALIAESIDSYYQNSVHRSTWAENRSARWRAIVESLRQGTFSILAESFGWLHESFADPKLNKPGSPKSDEYRKGYKTGWKRKHDEVKKGVTDGDSAPPQGGVYGSGFTAGYKASEGAQNLLGMHQSGDVEGAAAHASEINLPHLEGVYGAAKQAGQAGDEALSTWDVPEKTSSGSYGHSPAAQDTVAVIKRVNDSLGIADKKHTVTTPHPADYGKALAARFAGVRAGKEGGRVARRAGLVGGQSREGGEAEPLSAVAQMTEPSGEEAAISKETPKKVPEYTPGSAGEVDIGAHRPADIARALAEDPEAVRKHKEWTSNLEKAAYGPKAVAAHEAGEPHPGITDFRAQNYGPHQALQAQQLAHGHWLGSVEKNLRAEQAKGGAALRPRAYPTVVPLLDENGQPRLDGKLGYLAKSGEVLDPDQFDYDSKNPQHIDLLQHSTYDPVDVLMHSLAKDPYGAFTTGRDIPKTYEPVEEVYGQQAVDLHKGHEVPGVFSKKEYKQHESAKKKAKKIGQTIPRLLQKLGVNPAIDAYQAERASQGTTHEHHNPAIEHYAKNRSDYGGKAGWGVKALSTIPGYEHYTTGSYINGEGAEKPKNPLSTSISMMLNRSKTALHGTRDERGNLLAGTEKTPGKITGEHPMLDFNRGLRHAEREKDKGVKDLNLLAHKNLVKSGGKRVSGAKKAADNPLLKRGAKEGETRYGGEGGSRGRSYHRADEVARQLGDAIEFVLGVVQDWLQENVQVPEGRMKFVMEEIFSKVRPTYGHLFEVEGG